jgi:condensin complex subunit 2
MEAKASKKSWSSQKAKEEKRDEHTLPDDMHFSSRQLVTLSLKPKFSVGVSLFARDNKC